MVQVWPAILVTGVSFAVPQYLISNFINPWIVDIGASLVSMACLVLFLRVWQPKELGLSPALRGRDEFPGVRQPEGGWLLPGFGWRQQTAGTVPRQPGAKKAGIARRDVDGAVAMDH